MQFLIDNLPLFIAALVVLVVFVVILFGLLRLRASTKNPQVQAFLDGLLPFAYAGITSAEKAAQDFLTQFNKQLQGADKKKIADSWYALIPDSVWINGKPVPVSVVKQFVSREMFQELVKNTYDKMNAETLKAKTFLRSQVDYLVPDQHEPNKTNPLAWEQMKLAQPGDVG